MNSCVTDDTRALDLAQALIRCPSVTPVDAGALDVLQQALGALGFSCHRLAFGGGDDGARVGNLYARLGNRGRNFCFAGHTDVVPPGDTTAWSVDPFAGMVIDGRLYGRGAADMKGAIACFVEAVRRLTDGGKCAPEGSISLLITGDEEGPSVNGTRRVLDWLGERGERLDVCLVGEPTNPQAIGDMIKIGRRGSLNARLTVLGTQGHAAYPQLADNPVRHLVRILAALDGAPLDQGTVAFQPSALTITSVDVGNPAANVIPASARALFNIRYNDLHTAASLSTWLDQQCEAEGCRYELSCESSGDPFLCRNEALSRTVAAAVERITHRRPEFSTSGGTSDGRFIKDFCPVIEFGLVGASAHKIDENVAVADLETLSQVYSAILADYFGQAP
ncbi:Succinyl-diaminopimelate desuccinylase [uncultured Defluviicoccus sp.]|uniref:Succinyl-diaminopimelate desuccinylase n=1 Tax=metagenome TaxID=256318 RepID=A0A380TD18_9ZZZZ|nr:Succinyl-diaminopimelate desuccinylase [uncultured Defluviicoccus sp.]